jgi:hypothetical protein
MRNPIFKIPRRLPRSALFCYSKFKILRQARDLPTRRHGNASSFAAFLDLQSRALN